MSVVAHPTPNPNALKFTVDVDVGGPKTFVDAADADDPVARSILEIEGVTSVFMTADFVTLSKTADSDWASISPAAIAILESAYGE